MKNTNLICSAESCHEEPVQSAPQFVSELQKCLPDCSPESFDDSYRRYPINFPADPDCIKICIEAFEYFIQSTPFIYESDDYYHKVSAATHILKASQDLAFKEVAEKALNFILHDDFHESLKYGENHLDTRISLAKKLFADKEKIVKDIGAMAFLKYAKSNDITIGTRHSLSQQLLEEGYKDLGIEAIKSVVNAERFIANLIPFLNRFDYPRHTDAVKLWADVLGNIANDPAVKCEGRALAYDRLSSYHHVWTEISSNVFEDCRNNKVCINEITDSFHYVDSWVNNIAHLPDYPFACNE